MLALWWTVYIIFFGCGPSPDLGWTRDTLCTGLPLPLPTLPLIIQKSQSDMSRLWCTKMMEGLLRLQLTRDPFNWPICDIETVTSQIAVVLDLFFCRKVKQKVATKGSISSRALDLDVVFFYLINSARPILYLGDFTGIIQVLANQPITSRLKHLHCGE